MATGERGFSTADVEKTKRNFDPIPAGDYDLKLLADKAEIRTADAKINPKTKKMSEPVPRVSLRFEVLNSAKEEGGKNALLFHDLGTKMDPDAGGVIGPTQADQLKGLTDALGADGEFPFANYKGKKIIDPRSIVSYLKSHNGEVVRAHVKVQAGTKEYPEPKNKLTEFFAAGDGVEAGDGQSDETELPELGDDEALDELPDLEEEKPKARVAPRPVVKGKKR